MGELRERTNIPGLTFLVPGDLSTRTGGYTYDRRILEELRNAGWHVEVCSLDSSFPAPTSEAIRDAKAVLAAIPDNSSVVIDGLALGCIPEALRQESERLSLVALIHHPLSLETGLAATTARNLRRSEQSALETVRRVIVTSRWTARTLATYGVTEDRIRVVEPGVDRAPRLPKSAAAVRVDSQLRMLCVGTLTPRKGHNVLLDALAPLRDRPWKLQCIGSTERDPGTALEVRAQIARLGLHEKVELLGEVEAAALERCYLEADVFVLASHMEGYGMVLTEALTYGLPIVSTLAGAIPETVPATAGILVRPGDDIGLSLALASLMDEPEQLRLLTANAIAAGHSLMGWKEAAMKFATALEDLSGCGQ